MVHSSNGWNMRISNFNNITVTNTIFYISKKYGVYIEIPQNLNFTNNIIFGNRKRPFDTASDLYDITSALNL